MLSRPNLRRIAFLRRNRCSVLVAALCLFILLNPLIADSLVGVTILASCLMAILLVAMWAIRAHTLMLWVLGLGIATALVVLVAGSGSSLVRVALHGNAALFIALVTIALLRYVLDWHSITIDKVFGAVAAYILIAFSFASLFGLLQIWQPNAFHVAHANDIDGHLGWYDMIYFSFTVLTSTGFGEITPVTNQARSLIVVEQVLGVMYVAFLVARLANLYGNRRAGTTLL